MSYTPPVYPATIPSQTGATPDLPDRLDDLDWLLAARYNELKKELCAVMTELGTLPKGSYASVKERLDAIYPSIVNRGDPSAYDKTNLNFTADGNWHDLDLSSIIPAGAVYAHIFIQMKADTASRSFSLRKNGNSYGYATVDIYQQVANVDTSIDCFVALDANRVIEYKKDGAGGFITLNFIVKGWSF